MMRSAILLLALAAASPALADGKATYKKMCQSCHGADGRGNAAKAKVLKIDPEKLNLGREESANLTRAELETIMRDGKGKMPGYAKKLNEAELGAVLDYSMELAAKIRGVTK
jgi:mono/diheme cytochrome c family protein